MSLFSPRQPISKDGKIVQMTTESTSYSEKNDQSDELDKVEGNTENQKEFDALSALTTEFISVFYRNSSTQTFAEKEKELQPFLSEIGRKNLLKNYDYQEGTDMATTAPVTAKTYVNFDSVTGEAVVMAFMIYQTKYEDNPPVNAQTIVRIACTKNDENQWQVDDSELRLLNQPMPNSYYAM
ncbi:hypothetical protein [Enterococcus wangshanyuanii]|uniref:Uncharacterized protein n=2 Tax=Enterococcus wangshanyuanii TaxID=2005703 RepID=A0ABQ1PRC7_9ENTE|nr:hypothetical protein [Enterococcus wangshanyuanii]GGD01858.1 hypothetical protein GCM10011573_34230 [Enterococcus wangshanyuanii]